MKYKVVVSYRVPVVVEAENEQEARVEAWNKGAELFMEGGTFLESPAIEKIEEID
jgi:hypothetical protein